MGRLKNKTFDPGYVSALGNNYLESLNYSYNLHNEITGINRDYALKTPGVYNKWGNYFGMYLGYDNRDNAFTAGRLDGKVAGIMWNTQGDDVQRRYDFVYDNAGRLTNANYRERRSLGDAWGNSSMDFTVSGFGGKITYDLNGNILTMSHRGVLPGMAAPLTIDDLRYTYTNLSNKLQSVKDDMTSTTQNGKFGDFKDGANAANMPDYVYDHNGNLVIDLNKNVQGMVAGNNHGITYNYLDKPEQIRITGRGTIKIVYSADGEKLQRVFIPETAGQTATITTYIQEFVYQETSTTLTSASQPPFSGSNLGVGFINFEEGRIRVITPVAQNNGQGDFLTVTGNLTLPNSKSGVYDYFITDYQQNVRMILTEEIRQAGNRATMEPTRASVEEPIFGQTGSGNEVAGTRIAKPTGWTNNGSNNVSRLGNLAGKNLGPNTLQKVMAGDMVTANASYYFQTATGGTNTTLPNLILSNLLQLLTGGSAAGSLVKDNASAVTTQLGGNTGFINAVQPAGSGGTRPQAFLTILFFDERFNLISAADGGVHQDQVLATWAASTSTLNLPGIRAPKNGYVYVYLSNRSDQHVFFDDFNVSITNSNILEEYHYYSYGLRIAGISSKRITDSYDGLAKNNYQYQGAFSEMDDDIGWNDFPLRSYDAQVGRFVQMDPFDQFPSPYTGMANDPVNTIDPSGGIGIPCPGTSGFSIFMSNVANSIINVASSISSFTGVGLSLGLTLAKTGVYIEQAARTSSVVAGNVMAKQVGNNNDNRENSNLINDQSNGEDKTEDNDWKPLYKSDLQRYVGSTDENTLGTEFERLFAMFSLTDPLMRASNVRPNGRNIFTGGFRNTAPDFVGDAYVSEKKGRVRINTTIKGADWYELKQKTGGLYLSSNEDQIAGHIDNMRNSADYAYRKYGKLGYQSKLYVVTTADVKYSQAIYELAFKNNVLYEHIHAEYRIVNNKWQFRFKKTAMTNQKW
ncbi:MAG: hypothetical protein K2X48_13795 [Chitinophagaceae bacterium]|nr:hypothetical protein [Chitinophagaceae bacterium]